MSDERDVYQVTDARIAQMMRVMEVLHEKGVSFSDSLDVLRAIYDTEPYLPKFELQIDHV